MVRGVAYQKAVTLPSKVRSAPHLSPLSSKLAAMAYSSWPVINIDVLRQGSAYPKFKVPRTYFKFLIGCHIVCRVISVYDSKVDKETVRNLISLSGIQGSFCLLYNQYKSAVMTFDILRVYQRNSFKIWRTTLTIPLMGFCLLMIRIGFERFQWFLQETEVRYVQSCSLVLT
jgi:hypothetical protein